MTEHQISMQILLSPLLISSSSPLPLNLLRPWEVSDWDGEEAIVALQKTGKSVPPSNEGGEETEDTSSLEDRSVGNAVVVGEMADSEKEEGDVEEDEQRAEGNSRLEGA